LAKGDVLSAAVAGLALTWAVVIPATAAEPPAHPLMTLEDRGSDLPPIGRSLFDFLVAEKVDGEWVLSVPYPFEALMARVEARLRAGYREPVKRVLHPLGRSLHRFAADPDYFRFPRAVAAVDTDPDPGAGGSGLMLKDRLYIGYQPTTELIETISYNEAAGRFEYQVVTDYREGGSPQVTYADRGVCTACHHNQALIYAVQPWDESNANIKIAALLRAEAESFYGIPAQLPFDIPESFDESTDRANLFAAYQLAWQEGCGTAGAAAEAIACRRDGFVTALRYRLSGGYQTADPGDGVRDRFAAVLTRGWRARWPGGVAIPTPDLPDRDPLAAAAYGTGRIGVTEGLRELVAMVSPDLVFFDEVYEPLYERPPLETWKVAMPFPGMATIEPRWLNRVIAGLAGFLAAADIERLDEHLTAMAGAEAARRVRVECTVDAREGDVETPSIAFRCDEAEASGLVLKGRLRTQADGTVLGAVDRQRADSAAPGGLAIENGMIEPTAEGWRARFRLRDRVSGLNARLADGDAVRAIELAWPAAETRVAGTAVLEVAGDFAALTAAVEAIAEDTRAGRLDAFSDKPFRRVALLRPLFDRLGMAPVEWCCLEAGHLPPVRLLTE
jgi:hypothetical protein